MAYRDVEDWHRTKTRRRYPQGPLPVNHGWHAGGETSLDSLPYRRPKDPIQGPDEITSSPGRSRTSRTSSGASATVIETMPVPVLSRAPVTETYRRGRYAAADYAYDDFGETESPTPGRRVSPRRGRSPRAAQPSRPRRPYARERSSTSSESGTDTETDEESATSVSTQEEKRQRRHERAKREKERGKHEKHTHRLVVEERRSPPEERKKKTPKRRRKIKEIQVSLAASLSSVSFGFREAFLDAALPQPCKEAEPTSASSEDLRDGLQASYVLQKVGVRNAPLPR
ncbi:hypothetical protein CGLO_03977 [Colletotrichum gloeosporioides Cg-14]|uniref:Uncharacterized protein n=1 Tax=Colletotrichum gloeosporioides (strain Cg-14) TaxID=1237896 RepID=T0KV97_COLGC|nr:hypothetical protein CGLO_03977 [Colletotrichum gloeosporioides Cg-14]